MGGSTIPTNWVSFLSVNENKTELFSFLSVLHNSFQLGDKELVITEKDDVFSKSMLLDTEALTPCNQDDADSRMILYAPPRRSNCHKKILILVVDNDDVVLAVALARTLEEKAEVCSLEWARISGSRQPIRWREIWALRKHKYYQCLIL